MNKAHFEAFSQVLTSLLPLPLPPQIQKYLDVYVANENFWNFHILAS